MIRRSPARPRLWRLWQPALAAAACLILALVWQYRMPAPSDADAWPIQLATNIEIDDFEVYDDGTPLIVTTAGETATQVLWIVEPES